jgi:hypothetical protein
MDEIRAGALVHLGEDLLPAGGRRLAFRDRPAIAAHGGLLRLGRGAGHHDVAGDTAPTGGIAERQRVVAARMGRNALLRHLV